MSDTYFELPIGVRISNTEPIDGNRYIAEDLPTRDLLIPGRAHNGLQVFVESEKKLYILIDVSVPTWVEIGLESNAVENILWGELVSKQLAGQVEVWDRYNITDQGNLKAEIKFKDATGMHWFEKLNADGLLEIVKLEEVTYAQIITTVVKEDVHALHMVITTPVDPMPQTTEGGTVETSDNGNGTWNLYSDDAVTSIFNIGGKESITEVDVLSGHTLTSLAGLFRNAFNLTDLSWNGPCNATSLEKICSYNYKLTSFPALDTSKVTTMDSAWQSCRELTSFPALDTSNVTIMAFAWFECGKLDSFPALNTSKVTTMSGAWNECSKLTLFPAIDTSGVTSLNSTWSGCEALTSFPAINTSEVTMLADTWKGCNKLTTFPSIDTSKVKDFVDTWRGCTALTCMEDLDTTSLEYSQGPFYGCNALVQPAATGTNVRDGNEAIVGGIWTNPGTCS